MAYETRLRIAKLILMAGIFACIVLAHISVQWGQAQIFWLLILPVLIYLLWGGLHGTGRSARIVGYLGMAYCVSGVLASQSGISAPEPGVFTLFLLGALASIKTSKT